MYLKILIYMLLLLFLKLYLKLSCISPCPIFHKQTPYHNTTTSTLFTPRLTGELTTHNGRYKGNLDNGIKTGLGTLTFKNGQRYEGNWRNGRFNGSGREVSVRRHHTP